MRSARARLLAAWAVAAAVSPLSATARDDDVIPVTLALEDQANSIWMDLPDDAEDGRVTRLGGTSQACATRCASPGTP